MSIPSTADIDLALLVVLVRSGDAMHRRATYDLVAAQFPNLTPDDRAKTRKDGVTKAFNNMVNWSRNRLRVRGLLQAGLPTGQWQVTPDARQALISDLQSRGVQEPAARRFVSSGDGLGTLLGPSWATDVRSSTRSAEELPEAPPETPATAPETAPAPTATTSSLKMAIVKRLEQLSGSDFEQFIARLLDSLGFRDTQVVGRSGDEGVDVIAYLASPFVRAKVAVQVKRHSSNIGPRDISYLRDRWSKRSDRLLFITTSDFTAGAREVAADDHDKVVDLVNGNQLIDVMVESEFGVVVRPTVTYELDESAFAP